MFTTWSKKYIPGSADSSSVLLSALQFISYKSHFGKKKGILKEEIYDSLVKYHSVMIDDNPTSKQRTHWGQAIYLL